VGEVEAGEGGESSEETEGGVVEVGVGDGQGEEVGESLEVDEGGVGGVVAVVFEVTERRKGGDVEETGVGHRVAQNIQHHQSRQPRYTRKYSIVKRTIFANQTF